MAESRRPAPGPAVAGRRRRGCSGCRWLVGRESLRQRRQW